MNVRQGFTAILIFLCASLGAQDSDLVPTKFNYPSGQLSSEGFMKDGKPEGYWKTYYENGQLKSEGNRKDFQLHGLWSFFSITGAPRENITYDKGKRSGLTQLFKDSLLHRDVLYMENVRSGVALIYNEGGQVYREVPYEHDQENGTGYEFTSDGIIKVIMTYKDGFLRSSERLNRVDKLGRKQGLWKEFFSNRKVRTEGVYVDDLKNGLFKTFNEKGKIVIFEKYVNGRLDRDAAETTVLDIKSDYYSDGRVKSTGSYKDGKKHGIHREYDEDGKVIASTVYEYGEATSTGIIGKSGSYEGEWKTYHENGQVKAEGIYENGLRVNKWKFFHANGKISQSGAYKKGKPNGEWEWYYVDGSVKRKEYYRKGREDGESIEYNKAGEVMTKGEYVDGLKEGEWYYHVGDHTVTGEYRDGEKQGKWLGIYENGKAQFKGEYTNGLAIGKQKFYYASGMIKQQGKFNSGRKNGDWKIFDEQGEIVLITKFKNGIETHLDGTKISPVYQELGID